MKQKKFTKPSASIALEDLIDFPKLFEDFRTLAKSLSLEIEETTVKELWRTKNIRLVAPSGRNITGREKIIIFKIPPPEDPQEQPNEMLVIVCSSWDVVSCKPRPRGTDAGWTFIMYKGKAVHFAKKVLRTKNFAHNLHAKTKIQLERILARPKDTFSGQYMLMERGEHMFQRYWMSVQRNPRTGRFEKQQFNIGLSPESKTYIKKLYKGRRKYYKKLKEEKKQIGAAALRRKKWTPHRSTQLSAF